MVLIKWKAREFKYTEKSINWYWVFSSIILLISFSTFYFFNDLIFAILIIILGFLLLLLASKNPKIKKYEIDDKNFYIEDEAIIIPLKNIESYNIDNENLKILLNTKNKFEPLISVPFEKNQNIKKIENFLSGKITKNEKLKISIPELILNKIVGF